MKFAVTHKGRPVQFAPSEKQAVEIAISMTSKALHGAHRCDDKDLTVVSVDCATVEEAIPAILSANCNVVWGASW